MPTGAILEALTTECSEEVYLLTGPPMDSLGGPRGDADSRPYLIFFYGNGMTLADAEEVMTLFRRLGCHVLIPDYVGFGLSGGEASEKGCRRTAEVVHDHLTGKLGVDPARIVVGGWSLGAAVAIDLASRRRCAGLIALSPFTSLRAMARALFHRWLPVSLLLEHRFDNVAKIASVDCPVLIGHGTRDQVIPIAMGEQLASTAHPPATFVPVGGADHGDLLSPRDHRLLREMTRLVEDVARVD